MPENNLYPEHEMLQRIAGGDEAAFHILFQQYYASLVLYGEKFDLNRQDAEDVAMEVFGKLWKRREKIQEVRHLPAFLYTAMRNGCIDFLKTRKRADATERAYGEQALEEDYAGREMIRAEVLRRIDQEIRDLPEGYRTVFELTYYEGLNTREIAERLGISITNVTSRRSRALQLLKKELVKKDLLFLYFLLLQL